MKSKVAKIRKRPPQNGWKDPAHVLDQAGGDRKEHKRGDL
jgi:hypothetical protein